MASAGDISAEQHHLDTSKIRRGYNPETGRCLQSTDPVDPDLKLSQAGKSHRLTIPESTAHVERLTKILRDRQLPQFAASLLNFSYSLAVTRTTKQPVGTNVKDKLLATAAPTAVLRKSPRRR